MANGHNNASAIESVAALPPSLVVQAAATDPQTGPLSSVDSIIAGLAGVGAIVESKVRPSIGSNE